MKWIVYTLLFLFLACDMTSTDGVSGPEVEQVPMAEEIDEPPVSANDEEGRYAWQKPDFVINALGDLSGKVVADIGAGTGYFTFRLVRKADKIIAVDIDPDMIDVIDHLKESLGESEQTKVESRLAKSDNPNLENEEVDVALIINTLTYIEDREEYLSKVLYATQPGGKIMIVDFKVKRLPEGIAPPAEDLLSILEIENTLDKIGYTDIRADDTSLDYQYVITAKKPL